ncbi:MAG: choice-of-anchor Q domain-containing protein, partial [Bacillota bacterium]
MLRKIRRKCFVVLLSLVMVISLMPAITLTASAGTENIIYVNSNTGNDETGDGTSSNPYKTFTKGYSMVNYWGTLDLTGTFTWTDAAETGDAAEDGFQIAKSITIKGQGADETIIQAAASSGAAISRLFRFTDGLNVTFQDLEMRYGKTYKCGGGLYISTNYYNPSSVAILNCYIHDNSSGRSDVHESGGGIMLEGSVNLSIVNSTISNNLAYGDGGGICQNLYSSLTLTNSTICNNSGYRGGGIITWHATNGTSITNCTIAGNLAANYGGGIKQSGGNFYIKNNIIADNNATNDYGSKDYDYWSGSVVDNGNNIIEYYGAYNHPTAPLSGTTITGDQPNLKLSSSTPASNGTFTGTPTLALSSGSVAINAGNSAANGSISIPSADQRGLVRNGAVDIGAYEYGGIVPSAPTVSTDPATDLTITGATLNGSVDANNGSTEVTFEYGTTASYGSSVTASQSPVSGDSAASVSCTLSGLTPNTTYHYRVTGENVAGTANGADRTFTTLAVPPTVTTNAVTSATSTGAILNGSVNANNTSTEVTFEYGTTTSYGISAAAIQSPVTGVSTIPVSHTLTGLLPNTTYHYRVVGENTAGITNGLDRTFTTSVPPTAITNPVTSITSTGAILNGSVNANNASTAVTFEYGETVSYGSSVTASQSPASGIGETSVSYALTGLTPNTTYHYRVAGVNAAGTTNGLDGTFSTLAVPPTVNTNPVTSATSTGAILNGSVNANNASTEVIFEYGTTTSYGTSAAAIESPVNGTSVTSVRYALTALTPNTTYHYRVVGVNTAGTTNGLDGTFTTSVTPTVITNPVTSITSTGAILNGSVNSNNA